MVSSPHEAMHRIFQEYPGLFSRVSEVLGVDFAPPTSVTVLPTDLTEARPVERRVDTLLRLDTEDGDPLLLAVEAQGKKDPAKPASWAYYLSYLHTKYRLQPLLLVVCQDRTTAEWASRTTHIGPPQWPALTLRPLVAGPHNMPRITNTAEARKDLALATLSAITHAADPDIGAILKALSTALRDTPETIADPIVELTAQGLGKLPAAQHWRNLVAVDLSFYTSPLSEEIRDEGRAEGRAQGIAQSILLLLEQRDIVVPVAARERITSCGDPEMLRHWLARTITASCAEEIFVEE
ncbi:hypothetical protein HRW23_15745 [Streptomyces lunaelactis]|uniref:hypothetical protein n=1 Tax=Streptomyces lunaelactis TaxID=1535768 RepID=UPI0015845700|nr:hypothetical protein [Streptomyces lunaelactis]NUK11094.1 hypothetical protein [Streptomyces lunaelactis]NUK24694.1 hypothetical protein [Streptomyces lunaelactis]NUK36616.1 hypothetical protein [Streptomyces lunaelactis]NUK44142.1 hypothetical protein [Streptomyces lunaelactis]NUK57434.1 hypothetical protein [Streptomyces lunaelactis]